MPTHHPSTERLYGPVALFCLVLGFVALAWPIVDGTVYVLADLLDYHLPLRVHFARALAHGDAPYWWSDVFCGYYVHGEGQGGFSHPWIRCLYSTAPLAAACCLELVGAYLAAAVGTVLLLRRHDLDGPVALVGGGLVAFSGFFLGHHVHPNMVSVAAHLPWLLLLLDVLFTGEPSSRPTAAAGLTLVLASQLLFGHPQTAFTNVVALICYMLVACHPRSRLGATFAATAAVPLGAAIAAVQLLPTYETFLASDRATAGLIGTQPSLHPLNLVQLPAPYLFRQRCLHDGTAHPVEFFLCCGAATIVLAVVTLLRWHRLTTGRAVARFAALSTVLGVVLAFGPQAGLYRLFSTLPLVGSFHCPSRCILLTHFGLAILAAVGLQHLMDRCRLAQVLPWRRFELLWTLPSAAGAFAAVGILTHATDASTAARLFSSPGAIMAGLVLVTTATVCAAMALRGVHRALVVLVALAVLDPFAYGLSFMYSTSPRSLAALLQSDSPPPATFRRLHVPTASNRATLSGHRLAWGYVALPPSRRPPAQDPLSIDRLRLAAVAFVADGPTLPPVARNRFDRELSRTRGGWLVPDPLPRAFTVPIDGVSAHPAEPVGPCTRRTIQFIEFRLSLSTTTPRPVTVRRDVPGDVVVECTLHERSLLVLSERFHPGWTVRDGPARRDTHRVAGEFIAIVLDPGTHRVAFAFRPASLALGSRMSLASLILLGLAWLAATHLGRRPALPDGRP